MPFGLKNVVITYQMTMNAIFYDILGCHMKVYRDNILMKSNRASEHLKKSFELIYIASGVTMNK